MSNKLGLAFAIVAEAFKNKQDKGGEPYILHCIRVMNGVDPNNEDKRIAAVLHDVPEDCPEWTFDKLREAGFSERVIDLLKLLTHDKEKVSYEDYIKRISHDPDATDIKKADLRDNSDITRLKGLRKKDVERMEKYHRAYTYLNN